MKKRVPLLKIPRYLHVKLRRSLTSKERILVSENELKGKSMALKLITDPNSDLRMCPETFIKYVENDTLGAALIFSSNSIEFFDDYLHIVTFSERNYKAIDQVFNKHAANDRRKLGRKMRDGVKHSFDDMYDNIFKITKHANENSNI